MNGLVALHGFFGHPRDWEPLLGKGHSEQIYANIFEDFPITPFQKWAPAFNIFAANKLSHCANKTLIGYSLGGRLALHALQQAPQQWNSAVIISTHPGLRDAHQKSQRVQMDAEWAERIRSMPWKTLMDMWYSLEVFRGDTIVPQRVENEYHRENLAQALTTWSLGQQEDLQNIIFSLKMPILWIVGENDYKYREQAEGLQFHHPLSKVLTVRNAGHRVFLNAQHDLIQTINHFINLGIQDYDSRKMENNKKI